MSKRRLKWILFTYLLLFVIMTVVPINNTSISLEKINIAGIRLDHLIHIFIFFPFFLVVRLIKGINYLFSLKLIILWLVIGLSIAISTELIQLFIPTKSFTVNDLVANVIGIIAGSIIFLLKPRMHVNSN